MNKDQNKIQRSDHDVLVRLETKMDQVVTDISGLKDGFSLKLADHEARIQAIERVHVLVDPVQSLAELKKVIERQRDFSLMWKFIVGLVVAGSSIITWLLMTLAQVFNLFGSKIV